MVETIYVEFGIFNSFNCCSQRPVASARAKKQQREYNTQNKNKKIGLLRSLKKLKHVLFWPFCGHWVF